MTAVRRQQYELAIGDVIGSSIFDACISIGIGPLIFPISVSGALATLTGSHAILVSVAVILMLSLREKVDRVSGAFFIFLYVLSYLTLRPQRDYITTSRKR